MRSVFFYQEDGLFLLYLFTNIYLELRILIILRKTGRNTKTLPIKEAFNGFLDSFKLKSKFNEAQLISSWEKIMGKTIASRTEKIFIKSGTLFLKISSAPLRQELVLAKSKVIDLVNRELEGNLVEEVIFI